MKTSRTILGVILLVALLSAIAIVDADLGGIISADYLSPNTSINQVGTKHTVVATLINSSGPLKNLNVSFGVISGPNNGTNGSGITNSTGQATFTYRDTGGAGIDQIEAVVFPGPSGELQVPILSNIVTKKWVNFFSVGFMQGQGSILENDGTNIGLNFQLSCNLKDKHNKLEINWNNNKFELNKLTSTACFNDISIPTSKKVGFNTYVGIGNGIYNGVDGVEASWTFTDTGKHEIDDTVSIVIKDTNGNVDLNISRKLDKGDQKAHK